MSKKEGTKLCKHCKTEIPMDAKVCPNCRKKQSGFMKWIIIAVIVVIIIVALASGGDSESPSDKNPKKVGESTENTETQNDTKEVNNTFNVGDIVETSNLKISFLSSGEWKSDNEYMQPEDGKIYYRMEFEFENISDSDQTISSLIDWNCYADGYSVDQTWIGDDQLDATISPGKKAKGSLYYEVPADAEKIELEYNINYFTENKLIFIAK